MLLNTEDLPHKIAVGWSGGIDSTAILLYLKKNGYEVEAWHIDHAWREENSIELSTLKEICSVIGVEFVHSRLEHAKSDNNREAVARDARYNQFKQWSTEREIDFICLGHHVSDQAETTYMRLLSGSGIHGCSGMKRIRSGELNIARPALSISKQEMKEYLIRNGIEWIEDPSNDDNSIMRNGVRNVTFPAMRLAGTNPVDLFNRLSIQAKRVSRLIKEVVDKVELIESSSDVKVKASVWIELPPLLKKFLLQKMGKIVFGDGFSFGRKHLEYAASWRSLHGIDLTKSRLMRRRDYIILSVPPLT